MTHPSNIVMAGDIAERLKVSKPTVLRWQNMADFPAPIAQVRAGKVYDFSEVRAWRRAQLAERPSDREHYEAVGL